METTKYEGEHFKELTTEKRKQILYIILMLGGLLISFLIK